MAMSWMVLTFRASEYMSSTARIGICKKAPNVRENLKVNVATRPGVIYDDEAVFYKTKDVAMKLFIYAENIAQFWERWYSFLPPY